MISSYHLKASSFSLVKFFNGLETRELIPSRKALKEDLQKNLKILKLEGLDNFEDLLKALKTKTKIEEFSKKSGLSSEYLTLLRREVASYFPNPAQLTKFSGIDSTTIKKLANSGIKNSKNIFEKLNSNQNINEQSKKYDIPVAVLTEFIGLCDLSRLYGIGPVFAKILFDVGISSVVQFKSYSSDEIVDIYEKETGKKADFSAKDIQFSLDIADGLNLKITN